MSDLQDIVTELADELEVPGAAVGVIHDGQEHYAFAGVTAIENPLPVDERTLFQFGSTGKTYTATAIMRLVEQGKVDLDAPVRTYVPELELKDASVAEQVTVLQLLNHTAGWEGDLMEDMGDGDDALAKYVDPDGDHRAGLAAGRDGLLQQRVAVAGRPGDREGHGHAPTSRRSATCCSSRSA